MSTSGFNIHTIGVILMIAGAVGFVLSLLWMALWSDRHREARAVEQPEEVVRRRERY